MSEGTKIAVIRVRGLVKVKKELNYTMKLLSLHKKNYCVLIDKKDIGMIKKIKDYVTYGEIDGETKKLLIEKKGEKTKPRKKNFSGAPGISDSPVNKDGKEVLKRFFRLNPPRKGFGRKGIKVAFSKKGALGYRGDKINDLIKRML